MNSLLGLTILSPWYWHILCIIFETEALFLASFRFDQPGTQPLWSTTLFRFVRSGCVPCLTCATSLEISANVRIWSPGDVIICWCIPGASDWAPQHTVRPGPISPTHESTGLQSVIVSAIKRPRMMGDITQQSTHSWWEQQLKCWS